MILGSLAAALLLAGAPQPVAPAAYGLPLEGEEAEASSPGGRGSSRASRSARA